MLDNVFRPWLLALVIPELVAAVLAVVAMSAALRVLSLGESPRTSELALAIERRAELVATLFGVASAATTLALVVEVIGADRLRSSLRGAMCAWAVLAQAPWGFRSLGLAAVASLACAAWLALHRVDLALRVSELSRAKFALVLVVAPLVVANLGGGVLYALGLDFRVVASCCSTGLEGAREAVTGADGGARTMPFAIFASAAAASVILALAARRSRSSRLAAVSSLASMIAALASMPAILGYVAPHAYESPVHLCPFCLLDADGGYLGWPLYAALFAATSIGLAAGVGAIVIPRVRERDAAWSVVSRSLARLAGAWTITLLVALYPIARFAIETGGADLFGSREVRASHTSPACGSGWVRDTSVRLALNPSPLPLAGEGTRLQRGTH